MVLQVHEWIIYRDGALLAINKPAGVLALPDGYNPVAPHIKSLLEPEFGRLWIVHRLDRETSGVMLVARSPQAHRFLNDQFQSSQATKMYHALVVGSPAWEEVKIDLPLYPDGDRRHRTIVDRERGKPAVTTLRVLERFVHFTLVEAIPQTGRTHQLRAHLSAVGHPIVCDPLYGGDQLLTCSCQIAGASALATARIGLLERLGLHSIRLDIVHPMSRIRVIFDAPYSVDFNNTLKYLRQNPDSA